VVVVLDHTHLLGFGLLVLKEEVEELVVLETMELEMLELQIVVVEAVDPVAHQMPVELVEKEFVLSNFLINLRLILMPWMRVVVMLLTLMETIKFMYLHHQDLLTLIL
tara:strand:+ start:458 stop:781 length:324 start_codon:yes stop_codon:yes gene_type:complete